MSDLQRRSGTRLTRKQRETRAYRLTLATGGFGVVGVVTLVLAVVGIMSFGIPFLAIVLSALSAWMLRNTLNP
ncbi:hypothetical protein [Patulibacter americanus]|uniref:hypothetical protein n=1 Tax=Patulibacter americanus TaxID=588672 RepID=UPI0003B33421|nr:hypothetical protein [Patulibacter americanus]